MLDLRLPDGLPAGAGVQALVATLAGMGVDDDSARRAGAVVGELIREARSRVIFDESTASVLLRVHALVDRVHVLVQDWRAPDVSSAKAERLSWQLARLGFVNDLRSRSDASGNTTGCDILLRQPPASDSIADTIDSQNVTPVDDATAAQVVVRAANPQDASGIAGLAFRTVGFTHIDESLYSADLLAARLESGELVSFVAEAPDGDIVGHIALLVEADDLLPEWGRLMVDPRWRGRKLSVPLGLASLEAAHARKLPFLWSECTTRHTIAQNGSLAAGGVEVGLLIGAAPMGVSMAGFAKRASGRVSLMPYAIPVTRGRARTVHLPEHHWPIYREIAHRLGIERELIDSREVVGSSSSDIRVGVHAGYSTGRIAVVRSGEDVAQCVADEYLAMAASGLAVVYIDIGLHEPRAADNIMAAEANGFFWAAMLPEAREEGDVLRMQRIGWVGVDTEHAEYASEFGRILGDYVLGERARVMAPASSR